MAAVNRKPGEISPHPQRAAGNRRSGSKVSGDNLTLNDGTLAASSPVDQVVMQAQAKLGEIKGVETATELDALSPVFQATFVRSVSPKSLSYM
jgi:hypothetical protein